MSTQTEPIKRLLPEAFGDVVDGKLVMAIRHRVVVVVPYEGEARKHSLTGEPIKTEMAEGLVRVEFVDFTEPSDSRYTGRFGYARETELV